MDVMIMPGRSPARTAGAELSTPSNVTPVWTTVTLRPSARRATTAATVRESWKVRWSTRSRSLWLPPGGTSAAAGRTSAPSSKRAIHDSGRLARCTSTSR